MTLDRHTSPKRAVTTFLVILLVVTCPVYYLAMTRGRFDYIHILLWMWTPAIAGFVTAWILRQPVRSIGWKPGAMKYLAIAFVLPLVYGLIAYGTIWIAGMGYFPNQTVLSDRMAYYGWSSLPAWLGLLLLLGYYGVAGVLKGAIATAGEEIGWRGFLAASLMPSTSPATVAITTGIIWAVWHYPIIVFTGSFEGIHLLYALFCFTLFLVSLSFVYHRLRMQSQSLWPAVVLHASNNAFIQLYFTPLTGSTSVTPFVISEYGIALPLVTSLFAFLAWRGMPSSTPTSTS